MEISHSHLSSLWYLFNLCTNKLRTSNYAVFDFLITFSLCVCVPIFVLVNCFGWVRACLCGCFQVSVKVCLMHRFRCGATDKLYDEIFDDVFVIVSVSISVTPILSIQCCEAHSNQHIFMISENMR